MAKKIQVLGSHDSLKKSVACLLVRRLVAEWVIEGVSIRRLDTKTPLDIRVVAPQTRDTAYIPDRLPPFELPTLTFKDSEASLRNRESSQVARYHWLGNSSLRGLEDQTV